MSENEYLIMKMAQLFNKMKVNLGNKIIVLELAGSDILVRNMDNNFEKELAELGFQKAGNLYSLNLNPNNIVQKLI